MGYKRHHSFAIQQEIWRKPETEREGETERKGDRKGGDFYRLKTIIGAYVVLTLLARR